MNTSGLFTTHYYPITCRIGETMRLIPFGDVHRNAPLCSEHYWKMFCEKNRKSKVRTFYLGMGDYDDLASASEREILSNRNIHESTSKNLNKYAAGKVKELCKEISFMKGNLIGMIGGNHYWEFPDGTNSDQMMCRELDCKFLGVSSFIRLSFRVKGSESRTTDVDIWAHHGKGASRLVGGSFNRVEQMRDAGEADIYIMGHDHRKGAVTAGSKLELVGNQRDHLHVKYKKQWLVRSGSFLRGYVEGESSYVVDAAMNPTDMGVVILELTPKRDRSNGIDRVSIDIHAWS